MVNPDEVRGWIGAAEDQVRDLERDLERVQYRLAEARRRLVLLYELLASTSAGPVSMPSESLAVGRSTRERVQSDAEAILRDYGRPLRIQDIHSEFIRRGMPLPGRGIPNNIAAHLAVSEKFIRHGRGVYGLAEWETTSEFDERESAFEASQPNAPTVSRSERRQAQ